MSPEAILEDNKRVSGNRLEALLLVYIFGVLALPSRARVSSGNTTKTDNADAQIERVCEVETEQDLDIRVTLSPTNRGPSSFPTSPSGGQHSRPSRPLYVPRYRIAPKIVPGPGLGAAANPAGAGNGGGDSGAADECSVSENLKRQESKALQYNYNSDTKQNKDKKKKRRNSHLDRKVNINGHNFVIERAQVEKKTARHGVDLGLDPDIGVNGKPILDKKTQKPMAKTNKENYQLFEDKLEKLMKNSEMREGHFRKGRENQQETFNFYDVTTNRVGCFRKSDGKFISFWKLDKPGQLEEFLKNNNVI